MTHLEEGLVLTLRDEPAALPAEHARHVHECGECRAALDAARGRAGMVGSALDALDALPGDARELERARHAVRLRVAAESAKEAGSAPLVARAPTRASPRTSTRAFWSLSRAAGILLVTAAGLSALPGSPVRRWLERRAPAAEEALPLEAPAARATPEAPPEEAGVRLPLAAGPLSVVLRGAAPGTEIRVTWIGLDEAALFAPAGSRFASGEGRLEATLSPGPVRIEVRRGTSPLSIEADGVILLRSTSSGVEAPGPVTERSDAGITFVVPPR